MNKNVRERWKYLFTLLALDVFFDDTEVHFPSSSRLFDRFGVVTIGGVSSRDIGGDALLIFSDSDVRNLKHKKIDYFNLNLNFLYLFCFLFCCDCCFFIANPIGVVSSISIAIFSNSSRSIKRSSNDGQSLYGVIIR